MFQPFPSLYSSFLLPLNSASAQCTATKLQPVAKVGGGRIHSVPMISKVGGDASHGFHGAVAPMTEIISLPFRLGFHAETAVGSRAVKLLRFVVNTGKRVRPTGIESAACRRRCSSCRRIGSLQMISSLKDATYRREPVDSASPPDPQYGVTAETSRRRRHCAVC